MPIPLPQRPIAPLLADLRSGALLLPDYLAQLEARFEAWEPYIFSFVPEARRWERLDRDAAALQARWPDPATRPPLFGLSVGVKDIFHVDGLPTRAGSQLPAERLQGAEATAVTALKEAGALIIGKTVTTEFAYFGPGPTRNPYNRFHTPGGSSSGSAAAVAAGLCAVALGTQTIGSINRPAAFCGVVGYKPTFGRISTVGVIPLAQSLDHVGFFASDVAGAQQVAQTLCSGWQDPPDLPDRPLTLGVPEGSYLGHTGPEGYAHFQDVVDRLTQAGLVVKRVKAMPDFARIQRQHLMLMAAEAARFHAAWFREFGALYHVKTVDLIRDGRSIIDADIYQAQAGKARLRQQLREMMDAHAIDLWLTPSATGSALLGLDSTGDPIMNLPWTYAGVPTLTLRSGSAENGLPLAVQLSARWHADEALFQWGQHIAPLLHSEE